MARPQEKVAPSLQRLPAELIENITWHITSGYDDEHEVSDEQVQAICSFRLACKKVQEASRRTFSERCFYRRRIKMISTETADLVKHTKTLSEVGDVEDLAESVVVLEVVCACDGEPLTELVNLEDAPEGGFPGLRSERAVSIALRMGPLLYRVIEGLDNLQAVDFVADQDGPVNGTSSMGAVFSALFANDKGIRAVRTRASRSDKSYVMLIQEIPLLYMCEGLRSLEELDLCFANVPGSSAWEDWLGSHLGQQLASTVPFLSALKGLRLCFDSSEYSCKALSSFINAGRLPMLQTFTLKHCSLRIGDCMKLFENHAETLNSFWFDHVALSGNATLPRMRQLLQAIRDGMPRLTRFLWSGFPMTSRAYIEFPGMRLDYVHREIGDGWIVVYGVDGFGLSSPDEIQDLIPQMLGCLRLTRYN